MTASDRKLGMDRDIGRRAFLHDVSLAALGFALPAGIQADAAAPEVAETVRGTGRSAADYPPTRTGMRGSHPGSFEHAHALAQGGKRFPEPE